MAGETYLTQFICVCDRCESETMAFEIDGYVTVVCGKCSNKHIFGRPSGRLATAIVAGRLRGYFKVADRYGSG